MPFFSRHVPTLVNNFYDNKKLQFFISDFSLPRVTQAAAKCTVLYYYLFFHFLTFLLSCSPHGFTKNEKLIFIFYEFLKVYPFKANLRTNSKFFLNLQNVNYSHTFEFLISEQFHIIANSSQFAFFKPTKYSDVLTKAFKMTLVLT